MNHFLYGGLSTPAVASLPFFLILFFAVLALGVARIISSTEAPSTPIRSIRMTAHCSSVRELMNHQAYATHNEFSYPLSGHDFHVEDFYGESDVPTPRLARHYACPPTSVEELRRRYGTSKNILGDWSCKETRRFYRQQLPVSLRLDGVLGLSLEERARIAAEARHALRIYSRERCHLPGRLFAIVLDGLRHLQTYGYWRGSGMTWPEVWRKYRDRARRELGESASDSELDHRAYELIVERACATNEFIDRVAEEGFVAKSLHRVPSEVPPRKKRKTIQKMQVVSRILLRSLV